MTGIARSWNEDVDAYLIESPTELLFAFYPTLLCSAFCYSSSGSELGPSTFPDSRISQPVVDHWSHEHTNGAFTSIPFPSLPSLSFLSCLGAGRKNEKEQEKKEKKDFTSAWMNPYTLPPCMHCIHAYLHTYIRVHGKYFSRWMERSKAGSYQSRYIIRSFVR